MKLCNEPGAYGICKSTFVLVVQWLDFQFHIIPVDVLVINFVADLEFKIF